jgi:hypothetical protein
MVNILNKALYSIYLVVQIPGEVEKCDFESPNNCDFVSDSEGFYDWVRVPSGQGK